MAIRKRSGAERADLTVPSTICLSRHPDDHVRWCNSVGERDVAVPQQGSSALPSIACGSVKERLIYPFALGPGHVAESKGATRNRLRNRCCPFMVRCFASSASP